MNERALSRKQAYNCEHALELRCRCRCGGKLHGANRVHWPEALTTLPADDPHHIAPELEHALGPMRRVVKKQEWRGWFPASDKKRGVWRLTLECGHTTERKLSRRPPKKLHCPQCKDASGFKPIVIPVKLPAASRSRRSSPGRQR